VKPILPCAAGQKRHRPGQPGRFRGSAGTVQWLQRHPAARVTAVRQRSRRLRDGRGRGAAGDRISGACLGSGCEPLAELVGYGTSADAYHLTAGPEDGSGARRAMTLALAQAGIEPDQVQHLNAHATSTPVGDLGELAAIKALFGTQNKIAVTSTKSATGHLLGAAGGLEAIFTLLAIRDQVVPPTLNFDNPDPASAGVDIVHGQARPMSIEYALSNGFGFGGVNASVLFKRWQA
jgi:3-oxoacyl-[acyl-carrier-protein] synthase II